MRTRLTTVIGLSLVVVSVLFWPGRLSGQTASDSITVAAGACMFNDPDLDSVVLVEFPFTLNRHEFEFYRPDSLDERLFARVFAQVTLFGVNGLPVDSANTYFSVTVLTPEEAAATGVKLFNNLALLAKPGIYSARLTVIDVVSKAEGNFFLDRVVVELPREGKLTIGGKCLAYGISHVGEDRSTHNQRLLKHNFSVLSNPLGIYSVTDTVVYLYAELYNLQYDPARPSEYKLGYVALTETKEIHQQFGYRIRQKPGNSAVIVDRFDISGWPAGTYELRMAAEDLASGQVDTQSVTFTMVGLQASLARGVPEPLDVSYDSLSLEVKERLVHYLLNPVERQTLKSLTAVGKETFLGQYWREHDSDSETEVVENRREMLGRYLFCNNFFSNNVEEPDGWRTDRGRIYMTYGPWEERDDIQTPNIGRPFEVWYYHSIREGAVFVFEDKQGFEDYTLVHSNIEGERFSDEWDNKLQDELYKIY